MPRQQGWKVAKVCIHQAVLRVTLGVAGKCALEIGVSCEVTWGALCPVWGSSVRERLWQTIERHQDGHGLEHTRSEKRQRRLDLFRRGLRGIYTYLTLDAYREDAASLLSEVRAENKKVTSCITGNSNHMWGKKSFHSEDSQTLSEVAQRCWGVSIPADTAPGAPAWLCSQLCVEHRVGLQTWLLCKFKTWLLLSPKREGVLCMRVCMHVLSEERTESKSGKTERKCYTPVDLW